MQSSQPTPLKLKADDPIPGLRAQSGEEWAQIQLRLRQGETLTPLLPLGADAGLIWIPKNGCSTLLEKSHKLGIEIPKQFNKDFKNIELKKGDVVVWDGRIWHGAKKNNSKKDRWVIIVTFTRWFFKPHYDIARSFPKKFYKYLNVKLKIILGVASISKSSEKIGLVQRGDIKSANDYLIKKQF